MSPKRYLMVRRSRHVPLPGKVCFPGGGMNFGETQEAACIREAQEETRQRPRSADAWGRLGMTLLANKFLEESVVPFAHAEEFDRKDPRWPYLRGESLLPGDPDAALPHLRRAAELAGRGEADSVAPWLRLAEVLLEKREKLQ